MVSAINAFVERNNLSTWLTVAFVLFAVAMMEPGVHMIVSLPVLAALGFSVRWAAKAEGASRARRV